MERILNYTLTLDGVLPDKPLLAGYQGEHRATALILAPDGQLSDKIAELQGSWEAVCKIDAVTLAGEFIEGEKRPLEKLDDPFYLTSQMTASGLDTVVLVRIILKSEIQTKEIYKAQIKLYFEPSAIPPVIIPDKQSGAEELEQKAEEICNLIDERAQRVESIMDIKLQTAQNILSSSANQLKRVNEAVADADEAVKLAENSRSLAEQSAILCDQTKQEVKSLVTAAGSYADNAFALATRAKESADKATEETSKTQILAEQITDKADFANEMANIAGQKANEASLWAEDAKENLALAKQTAAEAKDYCDGIKSTFEEAMAERANAIKGSKSSKGVLITDISPVKHRLKVKLSGDNASGSKLTVFGKNVFNIRDWIDYVNSGIGSSGKADDVYLGEECFSYVQNKTAGADFFKGMTFMENTQYTISLEYTFSYGNYTQYSIPCLIIVYTDGEYTSIVQKVSNSEFTRCVFTTPKDKTVAGIGLTRFSANATVYVKNNMQIEQGTKATEFEPAVTAVTYTAEENGEVKGVQSIYPSMTLYADNGLTVSAEYNRDANKVVAELTQAIISLGGNI